MGSRRQSDRPALSASVISIMSRAKTKPYHISVAVVTADFLQKRGPTKSFEIRRCAAGEEMKFRLEPRRHRRDPIALAVLSRRGIQIGYVRTERATEIERAMKLAGAKAIFQRADPWGCTIRVSLDGSDPALPADENESNAHDWPPPMSDDTDWWPDHLW